MTGETTYSPNLIVPTGTRVVTLVEVRGRAGGRMCPRGALEDADVDFHRREYEGPRAELEAAAAASTLPEAPGCKAALDDLLIRVRLAAKDR